MNTPGTAQTANLTGNYHVTHGIGSSTHWFDPTAFTQPSGCTSNPCTNPGLGNTGRNQFRGPGYIQNNFSLFKSFRVYRETALEIRRGCIPVEQLSAVQQPQQRQHQAANFGQVTSTLGSGQGSVNGIGGGRSLQGSAKFSF